MHHSFRLTTALLIGFGCLSQLHAGPAEEFDQRIKEVYGAPPHLMTDAQITAKSKELDLFWDLVTSDTAHYLPLLREELSDDSNPAFFYFDGTKLLLSISTDNEDQLLALTALPRSDLRDIQRSDYLFTVFKLARLGVDTSDAAFKILTDPEFQVVIPQHALTLGQDFSLLYMLLPTSEDFYIQKAINRLARDINETAQESLLRLLWYTATDVGDKTIAEVAQDSSTSAATQKVVSALLSLSKEIASQSEPPIHLLESVADFVPDGATVAELRAIRRERLSRISDEALYELDDLTMLIRIKQKHAGNSAI